MFEKIKRRTIFCDTWNYIKLKFQYTWSFIETQPLRFIYIFSFFLEILLIFRERGREGERNIDEWEKHRLVASHTPTWGRDPQPRHVPRPGIKPATFQFTDQHSTHWATPTRASFTYFLYYFYTTIVWEVVTEIIWPTKPKIFTIFPFIESVSNPGPAIINL